MYKGDPGIKSKFAGVALHPYTSSCQLLTGRDRRSSHRPQGEATTRTRGCGLPSSAGAPNARSRPMPSPRARRPGPQLKGAFRLCKSSGKWKLQRVYWFSVDDRAGVCNFCGGSGLFGEGFVPKKSWYEYVKFTGGTP